jgi:chorismate mutase/prephenate dehydrogenase
MLDSTRGAVLGTHPLFGPGVHSFQGQRVVVCPGRGAEWQRWFVELLEGGGMVVTESSADEHDRMMALVQVLTHYQTQVMGLALARLGTPPANSRAFTSPAYLLELYVTARHFAQSAGLYGPIEMLNPRTSEVTAAFQQAAAELAEILASGDQARFAGIFEEVRGFFGGFTEEALEQSRFLIDRLVERSMG